MKLKLTNVARASLEELLLDYEDYARHNHLEIWDKDHPKAVFIRRLSQSRDDSYYTYRQYIEEKSAETAANTLICLIRQANFLLDRLKAKHEQSFLDDGGLSEKIYSVRAAARYNRKPGGWANEQTGARRV